MGEDNTRPTGRSKFQVLVLSGDTDLSVTVEESETVNFRDIKRHLERGDSIFITSDPDSFLDLDEEEKTPLHHSDIKPTGLALAGGPDVQSRPSYISDD